VLHGPDAIGGEDQAGPCPQDRFATLAHAVSAEEDTSDVDDPVPCTVCRGTGTVISNLGGSPSTQSCPWCDGTGTFLPEHDAQAERRAAQAGDPPA
jgi:DnaJ-class molecular chaperone